MTVLYVSYSTCNEFVKKSMFVTGCDTGAVLYETECLELYYVWTVYKAIVALYCMCANFHGSSFSQFCE